MPIRQTQRQRNQREVVEVRPTEQPLMLLLLKYIALAEVAAAAAAAARAAAAAAAAPEAAAFAARANVWFYASRLLV